MRGWGVLSCLAAALDPLREFWNATVEPPFSEISLVARVLSTSPHFYGQEHTENGIVLPFRGFCGLAAAQPAEFWNTSSGLAAQKSVQVAAEGGCTNILTFGGE